MKTKALAGLVVLSFLFILSGLIGCARVGINAITVDREFKETKAAIEKAEKSPGAQLAPEKIAKARELRKEAVETYWGCRTREALAMLDEARKLAREAEFAKAPPKPAPPLEVAAPAKPAPAKVAPAPAVPKPVAVPPKPKKIIILEGVNFGFDVAELTPQARAVLDEQIAILEKEPDIKVEIVGHTDSLGPEEYNKGLSEKRATVVKEYFISKGITPDRLEAVGYGESLPIDTNWTSEGRTKNRRVELNILK
jgi:outer membrane protein OmpA-like peptidoglycan-associated protein